MDKSQNFEETPSIYLPVSNGFTADERQRLRKAFPMPNNPKHKRKVIRVIAHRL
jgi:hypothetical protein